MDKSFVLLPLLYLFTGINGIPQSDLSLPVSGSINILAPQNANINRNLNQPTVPDIAYGNQGPLAVSTDVLMVPPQTEHILDLMQTFPSNTINNPTTAVRIIGDTFAIPNSELPLNIQQTKPAPQINVLSPPNPAPTQTYQQQNTGQVAIGSIQQVNLMDIPSVSEPTGISNTGNSLMENTHVVLTQPEFNPSPFQTLPQHSFEPISSGLLSTNPSDMTFSNSQPVHLIGSDYLNTKPRLMANMDYQPFLPQSFQIPNLESQSIIRNTPTVPLGSPQDPSSIANVGIPSDIFAVLSTNSGFQQSQLQPLNFGMQATNPISREGIAPNTGLLSTNIHNVQLTGIDNQSIGFQSFNNGHQEQPTAQNLGFQPRNTGHQNPSIINAQHQTNFQPVSSGTHTQPAEQIQGQNILNIEPQYSTVTTTQSKMDYVNTGAQTQQTTHNVKLQSINNGIVTETNTQPQILSNLEVPSTDLHVFQATNSGAQTQPSTQITAMLKTDTTAMNTHTQRVSNLGMPFLNSNSVLSSNTGVQQPSVQSQLNIIQVLNSGLQDSPVANIQSQSIRDATLQSLSLEEPRSTQPQKQSSIFQNPPSSKIQSYFGTHSSSTPSGAPPATEQPFVNTLPQFMTNQGIPPSEVFPQQRPSTNGLGQDTSPTQSPTDIVIASVLPSVTVGFNQPQLPFSHQKPLILDNLQSANYTGPDTSNVNLLQWNVVKSVLSKPILTSNPAQITQHVLNASTSLGPLSITQGPILASGPTQQLGSVQSSSDSSLQIINKQSVGQQPVYSQVSETQTQDNSNNQQVNIYPVYITEQPQVTSSNAPAQFASPAIQNNQLEMSQPIQLTNPQPKDPNMLHENIGGFQLYPNMLSISSQLSPTPDTQLVEIQPTMTDPAVRSLLTQHSLEQSRSSTRQDHHFISTQAPQSQLPPSTNTQPSLSTQYQSFLAQLAPQQPAQQFSATIAQPGSNFAQPTKTQLRSSPIQLYPTITTIAQPRSIQSQFHPNRNQPGSVTSQTQTGSTVNRLQPTRIVQGSTPKLYQSIRTQPGSTLNQLKPTSSQSLNPVVPQIQRFFITPKTQQQNQNTSNSEVAKWKRQVIRNIQGSSPSQQSHTSIPGFPMPDSANVQAIKEALERFVKPPASNQQLHNGKITPRYNWANQRGTQNQQLPGLNSQWLNQWNTSKTNLMPLSQNIRQRKPVQNTPTIPMKPHSTHYKSSKGIGELHAEWATYSTNNPVSMTRIVPVPPSIQPANTAVQDQPSRSSSSWFQLTQPGPRVKQFQPIASKPESGSNYFRSARIVHGSTPYLFQPTNTQQGSTPTQMESTNSQSSNPSVLQTQRIPIFQRTQQQNQGIPFTQLSPQRHSPSADSKWQLEIIRNIQGKSPLHQSQTYIPEVRMPNSANFQTLKDVARQFPMSQTTQFTKPPANYQQLFNRQITPTRANWELQRGIQHQQLLAHNSQWENQWNTQQNNLNSMSQNIRQRQQIQNIDRSPLNTNSMSHYSNRQVAKQNSQWATYTINNPGSVKRKLLPIMQPASRVPRYPYFQPANFQVAHVPQSPSIESISQHAQVGELVSHPIGSKNILKNVAAQKLPQGAAVYNGAASSGNDMLMNLLMIDKLQGGGAHLTLDNLANMLPPPTRQMKPKMREIPTPNTLKDSLGYYDPILKEFIPHNAAYGPEFVSSQSQIQPKQYNPFFDGISKSRLTAWNHIKKLPRRGLLMDFAKWRMKMGYSMSMPTISQFVQFLKTKINVLAPMFVTMQPAISSVSIFPGGNPMF